MSQEIKEIRQRVKRAEMQLKIDKDNLDHVKTMLINLENKCPHKWGPIIADHIHHEAHTIPGDPPGTMGVDWRGPCNVSASTDKRWKRVCVLCDKVEHTTAVKTVAQEQPFFGGNK